MPGQMGQPACAIHMYPVQLALHPHARFIPVRVRDWRGCPRQPESRLAAKWSRLVAPSEPRSYQDLAPAQFGERLTGAQGRDKVRLMEISRQRLHLHPILGWLPHLSQKRPAIDLLAGGT